MPSDKRRGSKHCDRSCTRAASRALCRFESRVGEALAPAARAKVFELEAKGWLRLDALQAVNIAIDTVKVMGAWFPSVKIHAPVCTCGRALPGRWDALTCGRSACRMKRKRKMARIERKRLRVDALFRELLRTRRWLPFSVDDVTTMAVSHRVRHRDVAKLLRELVQDGCAFEVVGIANMYAFVPPRARRLAA